MELRLTKHRARVIADVIGDSSLILPYFFVYFRNKQKSEMIFAHQT